MRVNVDEPGLDFGDSLRILRSFRFLQQRIALQVGFQDHADETFRAVGRFLREAADAPARRQCNAS